MAWQDGTMFSSTTLFNEPERRSRPREALQCAVLVYFDNENWGNLIEINEGGMSIACAEPLPVHQRMNFTFHIKGWRNPVDPGAWLHRWSAVSRFSGSQPGADPEVGLHREAWGRTLLGPASGTGDPEGSADPRYGARGNPDS